MAKTDLFKRTLEAGTSFLDMSRERAETVVKEWVEAGDLRKGRAQQAIDDVLARSRKATDDLRDLIRREIREQLGSMGVATADDIARLEAKIDQLRPAAPAAPASEPPAAPPVKKMAKATKKAATKKAATKGAAIGKAGTTTKKAPAAKPAAGPAAPGSGT
jgi:polyhydroxyalkanoate synthesis regulator phasin